MSLFESWCNYGMFLILLEQTMSSDIWNIFVRIGACRVLLATEIKSDTELCFFKFSPVNIIIYQHLKLWLWLLGCMCGRSSFETYFLLIIWGWLTIRLWKNCFNCLLRNKNMSVSCNPTDINMTLTFSENRFVLKYSSLIIKIIIICI